MKLSFPTELTKVNDQISVLKIEVTVYYYKDSDLIYTHKANDKIAFRFIVCQLFISRLANQTEMRKVFKTSKNSLIGWIKNYKKEGAQSFYRTRKKGLNETKMHRKRRQNQKSKIENIVGKTKATKRSAKRRIYL